MSLRNTSHGPLFATLLAVGAFGLLAASPRSARADDAACFAASEQEIALHKENKYQAAREQLVICSASTCPAEVRDECARRIVALNAVLPTLVLAATDAAGNDLIGVTVTLDGAPLPDALSGRAVPVDPGNHTLHFEAAGKPPVTKTIVAHEGEKDRRITVVLAPEGAAPAAAAVAPPPAAPASSPSGSTWSTQKTFALIAGGVGVAGLVLGAGFGAAAISDWSTEQNDCKSSTSCSNPSGATSAHSSVETAGAISTVGFIVGGVGLAGGAVLWFTAPKGGSGAGEKAPAPAAALRLSPMVGPGVQGMLVGGTF